MRRAPLSRDDISPIVSDVPLPIRAPSKNRRYLFEELQVGDSFTLPVDRLASLRVCLSRARRQFPGRDFTYAFNGDRIRVWRIQ